MSVLLRLEQLDVPPGQHTLLHAVSWEQYEAILTELPETRGTRLLYWRGTLEIMAPSFAHEVIKRLLSDCVFILTDVLDLPALPVGSMTLKRQKLAGAEPDDSFYIASETRVRGKDRIVLPDDPPPDLVIEVDLTSSSVDKLPIYIAMEVPEVWLYREGRISFLLLSDQSYVSSDCSRQFPFLAPNWLQDVLDHSDRRAALRLLRRRLEEHLGQG
jgi:Uma2 family endonuclease